jgi:superfamily II DNA or RNA helicase
MNLLDIYQNPLTLLLLSAPPAWGKTRLLLELIEEKRFSKWVFVSPLRALADEFSEVTRKRIHTIVPGKNLSMQKALEEFKKTKRCFFLMTPEQTNPELISLLEKEKNETLIIFDEFHLWPYWGDSFRPSMWQSFEDMAVSGSFFLGLSATLSDDFIERTKKDLTLGLNHIFYLNIGNQRLKNWPKKTYFFPTWNKKALFRRFHNLLRNREGGVFLYFCRYRHEVDRLVQKYQDEGLNVIGCKGGETETFRKQLEKNPKPDCIFATTALSHGVNLPSVNKIFLSYPTKNLDFWVQMVGRGGRRGEEYELYTFDSYFLDFWQRSYKILLTSLYDWYLSVKERFSIYPEGL